MNWNVGGTGSRETQFVPTYNENDFYEEEEEKEEEFQVYENNKGERSPFAKKTKMTTIREDKEEQHSDEDLAYFSGEGGDDFNNRSHFDSEEEEDFKKIREHHQSGKGFGSEEEDIQPYDELDSAEEERRLKEEFGDEEEEEEGEPTEIERMSMTMHNQKIAQIVKELKSLKARQLEFQLKVDRKIHEGNSIAGPQFFNECYTFFSNKAANVRLYSQSTYHRVMT